MDPVQTVQFEGYSFPPQSSNKPNICILLIFLINSVIAVVDRILEIIYVAETVRKGDFISYKIKGAAITFAILVSGINLFFYLVYILCHYEPLLTWRIKFCNLINYVLGMEIGYPVLVHRSFYSRFVKSGDSPLLTTRVVNSFHFLFLSLPNLLIISVNSTGKGDFTGLEIASLIFSCLFIFWCGIFILLCGIFMSPLEDFIVTNAFPTEQKDLKIN